jgi:hypothetical protein
MDPKGISARVCTEFVWPGAGSCGHGDEPLSSIKDDISW